MPFFGGFKKNSLELIINISNFSIDAILVEFNQKDGDKVIKITRNCRLVPEECSVSRKMFNYGIDRGFIKILEAFQKEALRKKGRIKSCLVVFSAPWYTAQTHIVKIKKEKPFIFSKNFFQSILKQKIFKKENSLKFVEGVIMKVLLNGYEIKKPFGKTAKTAELFIYAGAITEQVHSKTIKLIKEFLNLEPSKISIKTFPIIALLVLRDIFDFSSNSLLIDFGPEITELILIKNRHIEEIITFNKGWNILTRRLASVLKIDTREAEHALKRRRSGTLEDSVNQKINSVTDEFKNEWCSDFNNALNSIEKEHMLPKNAFFLSQNQTFDIPLTKFKKINNLSYEALDHAFHLFKNKDNLNNYNIHFLLEMLYLKKIRK
jgi:hypothetical protein